MIAWCISRDACLCCHWRIFLVYAVSTMEVDGLNGRGQKLEDVDNCGQHLMPHQQDLLDEQLKQEQVEMVEPEPPPEPEEANQIASGRKTKVKPMHHSNVSSACEYNLKTNKSEDDVCEKLSNVDPRKSTVKLTTASCQEACVEAKSVQKARNSTVQELNNVEQKSAVKSVSCETKSSVSNKNFCMLCKLRCLFELIN